MIIRFFSAAALAFAFVATSSIASAAMVVVVTDQPSQAKAKEVVQVLRTTAPFSRLRSFNLRIVSTTTKTLGCDAAGLVAMKANLHSHDSLQYFESVDRLHRIATSTNSKSLKANQVPPSCGSNKQTPARLITCDTPKARTYLGGVKARYGASHVLVVLNVNRYGGSGGTYPVITVGSPASMAIHEFMHQLGFADEYAYISACEADTYCDLQAGNSKSKSGYGNLPGTAFNVALFNSFNSYIDDEDVLNRHRAKLPWASSIRATTPLQVNGKLGTPSTNTNVGVYDTNVCDLASKRLDTWQAVGKTTIMKSLSTTYIPESYWPIVAKSLGTTIK